MLSYIIPAQLSPSNPVPVSHQGGEAISADTRQAIACRFIREVVEEGNFALAAELIDPAYVFHFLGSPTEGDWESCKAVSTLFHHAFPDVQVTIQEQLTQGDVIVTSVTCRGTQQGEFQGIPPSGEPVTFGGIITLRIANDKIVEHWHLLDVPALLRQLGLAPA